MRKITLLLLLSAGFFHSCQVDENETSREIAMIETSLGHPVQIEDRRDAFSIAERMEYYKVPGVSIAVVKDGALHWAKAYGTANTETCTKVETTTLFQAASISKPLAALAVLRLAEEGQIDLEQDVNTYLKGWKLPENKFTRTQKVTPRRLLTHTAGLNVHGFPGYSQQDTFPSLTQVLRGEGNTAAIYNDTIPGSRWSYSGGGYTILEKMVEDVSGMPFEDYLEQHILQPMNMRSSTYRQPLPEELHQTASAAYDREGNVIEGYWHNYPEKAAAGLWTTPTDLAHYVMEIQNILKNREGVISRKTALDMLSRHEGDWGLGPQLRQENGSIIFQHGGKNAGFTNNMVAFAHRGDAVIVMTNADNARGLIEEIIRAVSTHYHWDLSKPKYIRPVKVASESLKPYIGRFQWTPDPGRETRLVEVKVNGRGLLLSFPDNGEELHFLPTENSQFVELSRGHEMRFRRDPANKVSSFVLNDHSHYRRVE